MYIDTWLMIAINIALLSLMGALTYAVYLLRLSEQTIDAMARINTMIRRENVNQ